MEIIKDETLAHIEFKLSREPSSSQGLQIIHIFTFC